MPMVIAMAHHPFSGWRDVGAIFYDLTSCLLGGMKGKVQSGMEKMIGRDALVIEDIDPDGKVEYGNEIWSAVTEGRKISKGEKVQICGFQGMRLIVNASSCGKDNKGEP